MQLRRPSARAEKDAEICRSLERECVFQNASVGTQSADSVGINARVLKRGQICTDGEKSRRHGLRKSVQSAEDWRGQD